MEKFLGRYSEWIYGVTRIVVGMMFWMHGTTKLFNFPAGARGRAPNLQMFSLLWTGGAIECVGGLLIIVGLWTSWAAFICSGEMAAAYFMAQFPFAILPIHPRPGIVAESSVFNAFFFLYVASKGAGPLSLDHLLRKYRRDKAARATGKLPPTELLRHE
jgi:putative oxidoreductase